MDTNTDCCFAVSINRLPAPIYPIHLFKGTTVDSQLIRTFCVVNHSISFCFFFLNTLNGLKNSPPIKNPQQAAVPWAETDTDYVLEDSYCG